MPPTERHSHSAKKPLSFSKIRHYIFCKHWQKSNSPHLSSVAVLPAKFTPYCHKIRLIAWEIKLFFYKKNRSRFHDMAVEELRDDEIFAQHAGRVMRVIEKVKSR